MANCAQIEDLHRKEMREELCKLEEAEQKNPLPTLGPLTDWIKLTDWMKNHTEKLAKFHVQYIDVEQVEGNRIVLNVTRIFRPWTRHQDMVESRSGLEDYIRAHTEKILVKEKVLKTINFNDKRQN